MRGLRLLVAIAVTFCAVADALAAETTLRVEARDSQSLQGALLALAEERLQPLGLHVDSRRVWLNLSADLPGADFFVVRPREVVSHNVPNLPLVFELQPERRIEAFASDSRVSGDSIIATLGVSLTRDVWVASRRLRKGSRVTCGDLVSARRPLREVSQNKAPLDCVFRSDAVALREFAKGDVILDTDVGEAPAVAAGSPVSVSVASGDINVSTIAVALADAKIGDQIDVRLRRPTRTLRTRVTGPGQVQLAEESR